MTDKTRDIESLLYDNTNRIMGLCKELLKAIKVKNAEIEKLKRKVFDLSCENHHDEMELDKLRGIKK